MKGSVYYHFILDLIHVLGLSFGRHVLRRHDYDVVVFPFTTCAILVHTCQSSLARSLPPTRRAAVACLRFYVLTTVTASSSRCYSSLLCSNSTSSVVLLVGSQVSFCCNLLTLQDCSERLERTRHQFCNCNCNCNGGTCIAPPTRRPRAHRTVNPYHGARKQN